MHELLSAAFLASRSRVVRVRRPLFLSTARLLTNHIDYPSCRLSFFFFTRFFHTDTKNHYSVLRSPA